MTRVNGLRKGEQLGGFHCAKEYFSGRRAVLAYLTSKGERHEANNNCVGNCPHVDKHIGVRTNGWGERVWIGHATIAGLVHSSGGYVKRRSHMAKHWPSGSD